MRILKIKHFNRYKMNPKRLSGIVMLFLVTGICFSSCRFADKNDKTVHDEVDASVKRLLYEADNLIKSDSAFLYQTLNCQDEHTASENTTILQKFDSAILLAPKSKIPYIHKYNYLAACKKPDDILSLLKEMDSRCDSIQGDFLCLKGVLEYHNGDSINGKKSFQRADKAFHMEITNCSPNDSLKYASLKLSQSLNLSLMKNDFSIFQNELNIFHKTYPQIEISSMNQIQYLTSREEYYQSLFNSR